MKQSWIVFTLLLSQSLAVAQSESSGESTGDPSERVVGGPDDGPEVEALAEPDVGAEEDEELPSKPATSPPPRSGQTPVPSEPARMYRVPEDTSDPPSVAAVANPNRVEVCWPKSLSNIGDRDKCKPLGFSLYNSIAVASDDVLVFRVLKDDEPLNLKNVKTIQVAASVKGVDSPEATVLATNFEAAKKAQSDYFMIQLRRHEINAHPSAIVSLIAVAVLSDDTTIDTTVQFELNTRPEGYRIGPRPTTVTRKRTPAFGPWLPAGLVGAHFKAIDDKGLSFSAIPLALAGGSKFYLGSPFYLGLSAFVAPTLYQSVVETEEEIDDDGDPSTPPEVEKGFEADNFTVAGFTLGALLDINNIFLVGVGYTFDVRKLFPTENVTKEFAHPGVLVTLGFSLGAPFGKDE